MFIKAQNLPINGFCVTWESTGISGNVLKLHSPEGLLTKCVSIVSYAEHHAVLEKAGGLTSTSSCIFA